MTVGTVEHITEFMFDHAFDGIPGRAKVLARIEVGPDR